MRETVQVRREDARLAGLAPFLPRPAYIPVAKVTMFGFAYAADAATISRAATADRTVFDFGFMKNIISNDRAVLHLSKAGPWRSMDAH